MLSERFWAKVHRAEADGCWVWTANKNNQGYGLFRLSGHSQKQLAHRLSYEDANGAIPRGLFILHSCDNPSCVNPAHLRAGTRGANSNDMYSRSRHPHARSDEEVAAIRRDYVAGLPINRICEKYALNRLSLSEYTTPRYRERLSGTPGYPTPDEVRAEGARRTRNNAKIDQTTADNIRARLEAGEKSVGLAAEYGLSKSTIADIKYRRIWAG